MVKVDRLGEPISWRNHSGVEPPVQKIFASGILTFLLLLGVLCAELSPCWASDTSDLDEELKTAFGSQRVDLLLQLSDLYVTNQENGQALDLAREALILAEVLDYQIGIMRSHAGIGMAQVGLGDFSEAVDSFTKALEISRVFGDGEVESAMLGNLGYVFSSVGDLDQALDLYFQAVAIDEAFGYQTSLGIGLGNIGTVYTEIGDHERALEYYQRALAQSRLDGDHSGASIMLVNMASALVSLGDNAVALERCRESLAISEEVNDRVQIALAESCIGDVLTEEEDFEQGIKHYLRSLRIQETLDNREQLAELFAKLALIHARLGRHISALEYVESCITLSSLIGAKPVLMRCLENASEVSQEIGDLRGSLEHFRRYSEVRDEILTETGVARIADLEVRFSVERRHREIELLRRSQRIQKLLIELITASLAIVGLVAMLIVGRLRLKTKMNHELDILSRIDHLTGIPNRRDIIERGRSEVTRSKRSGRPFAIVIADIDGFKMVNDLYGHYAGDAVLGEVAATLLANIRGQDHVGRWGGEEFLMVLPETDLAGGASLAEKLRRRIEDLVVERGEARVQITMTFGVSSFDGKTDLEACINRADEALLNGKGTGKNRVVLSQ